eukprot:755372-Hanusia_phi.AAC.3
MAVSRDSKESPSQARNQLLYEIDLFQSAELYEYYRAIYQTVTEDDYKSWEKKYPGSQEEKEDIAA